MNWLNNGSKTLVMVAAIVMLGLMALKGVLTLENGATIAGMALSYCGINVAQNRAANGAAPPAP